MYSSAAPDADGPGTARAAASGARGDSDASTRDRVLQLVVEQGPISAAALGRTLELTAAAVRRHLDVMTEQGVVEVKNVTTRRKGAGRPSRRYVISQRGQQSLGDDYLTLVHEAIGLLGRSGSATPGEPEPTGHEAADAGSPGGDAREDTEGEPARRLASAYFSRFEERYRDELADIDDLDERTRKLSELFNADGFAGFTRLVGRDSAQLAMQSTQLCQGHCPVLEIAAEHPVFCEEETNMIARLLEVDVRRLSTQGSGAHVCTTHVPVGREKQAQQRQAVRAAPGPEGEPGPPRPAGPRKRIVISPRQQERFS